ncbi:unnamed protein product [Didymodactylos carnosus]|uniref:Uncharacterized protein n=1 Tax=Didymodactylos carnosus TaxID=1234261 RepID=A0A815B8I5_9BILA|nr:unnamed protein product [Didymodactylos carnosus]CAF1266752.1 unnamed protein product [Didymodactylos carnosus]CAF4042053.1 unnamed protein product [Didymodactylos carnosus]CAF4050484.1 unnamed protein product [Didymodactylos carnosus]
MFRCQNRDYKGRCHTNLATDLFLSQPTAHSHVPNPDHRPISPLVYGLLIRKSATDYNKFFKQILAEYDFDPDLILTDFEVGTIRSVKTMLLNVLHKVAKLANKIHREQSKFEVDIAQVRQGHEPKPKKASYRKRDNRIKRLVNTYDTNYLDE